MMAALVATGLVLSVTGSAAKRAKAILVSAFQSATDTGWRRVRARRREMQKRYATSKPAASKPAASQPAFAPGDHVVERGPEALGTAVVQRRSATWWEVEEDFDPASVSG